MSFALSQEDVKALNEDQKVAVCDALVAAAWADGNVSQQEKDRFEAEMVKLPWGKSEAELIKMIHDSVARVAGLKDRDSVVKFIEGIATRLPQQGVREKVLYTMGAIMFSDRDMKQEEKNVLKAFTEAFQLPMDRAAEIAKSVKEGN